MTETISLSHDIEVEYSKQLTQSLEKKFGIWKDTTVEIMLSSVLKKLSVANPIIRSAATGIKFVILNVQTPFAFPGLDKTVYLSKGALAAVEYENELAFLICTPIVMIEKRLPETRFESLVNEEESSRVIAFPIQPKITRVDFLQSGWFNVGGFFDFGTLEYMNADKEAVAIPPKARFDHRGAVSLYQRFMQEPKVSKLKALVKFLPDIGDRFENIKEESAKILPIRDAVLKSRAMRDYKSRFKDKG